VSATPRLKLALAQLNLLVGDIGGNATQVLESVARSRDELGADLLVCPELTLSGYPPEDLLFHRGFERQIRAALERVRTGAVGCAALVGYPEYSGAQIFNSASVFADGKIVATHRKASLPNYRVFDEKRYFKRGNHATVVELRGFRVGILICEEVWDADPGQLAIDAGAEMLIIMNASPYEWHKQANREDIARRRALDVGVPLAYCNLLGGQDELVFDGGSFVMNAAGEVVMRAPAFEAGIFPVEFERTASGVVPLPGVVNAALDEVESAYRAIVLGVRDYVDKHGFPGVVIGLSGGIDSALTLAIAVDALGADRVHVAMMPSRYTSDISVADAEEQARVLGVQYSVLPIEQMFQATLDTLREEFAGRPADATEENIQARCRMLILMGISNKTGKMLLTTGNKSEMSVGYATLYGDMAGGFAPIKDCSKTLVYRMSEYRNSVSRVIPQRVIDRPPSAELRPDQRDSDSLPPYEVLDAILAAFIEDDLSVDEICERGFERATVGRVLDMVKRNEYKRRQTPPGVRVSRRAFGRDWRYPITNGYRR